MCRAASRWPESHAAAIERFSRTAQPEALNLARGTVAATWTAKDLADWMLVPVETRHGPGFADRGLDRYRPTVDLLDLGLDLADAIDHDRYRTIRIALGAELPSVWFPSDRRELVDRHLAASRAGMVVSARPIDDDGGGLSDHQFSVFVTELRDAAASAQLAAWSDDNPDAFHASLALSHGALLLVVVARSTVMGVEHLETDETLRRFESPFTAALAQVPIVA